MKDRFAAGFFAGIIGDVVLQVYFLLAKLLGLTDRTYVDYGKILVMSDLHKGILAYIVGMVFEFVIGASLGILLAYIIKYTSSRFHLLKAIGIGMASWLVFLTPGTLFRLTLFDNVPPQPSLIMLIGSMLWGVVTAVALKKITKDFRAFFSENEL